MEAAEHHEVENAYDIFLLLVGTNKTSQTHILKEQLGHQLDSEKFRIDWGERYNTAVHENVPPLLTGATELLQWLKSSGIPIAMATSSPRQGATRKLIENNIEHYFDTVTTGDDVVISKPNPEIYQKAAASIQVDPSRSWALEDSENGIKAALAAGLQAIQVPNLVPPSEELLKHGHTVCQDLHEVLQKFQIAVAP